VEGTISWVIVTAPRWELSHYLTTILHSKYIPYYIQKTVYRPFYCYRWRVAPIREAGIQWPATGCSRNQPSSKKKIEQQKKANTNTKVVCWSWHELMTLDSKLLSRLESSHWEILQMYRHMHDHHKWAPKKKEYWSLNHMNSRSPPTYMHSQVAPSLSFEVPYQKNKWRKWNAKNMFWKSSNTST
jgi:hypothetical protein